MASIAVTRAAQSDLREIVETHHLPADSNERVVDSIAPLADFPRMGKALSGRWKGTRVLIGPWAWFLIIYQYEPDLNQVKIIRFEDARQSSSFANSGDR